MGVFFSLLLLLQNLYRIYYTSNHILICRRYTIMDRWAPIGKQPRNTLGDEQCRRRRRLKRRAPAQRVQRLHIVIISPFCCAPPGPGYYFPPVRCSRDEKSYIDLETMRDFDERAQYEWWWWYRMEKKKKRKRHV